DKSKEFRQKWLNSVLLKEVVNFAHVRDIFFRSGNKNQSSASISPFASIIYTDCLANIMARSKCPSSRVCLQSISTTHEIRIISVATVLNHLQVH
ncbi:MAG: hypothetical protein ACKO90_02605, partial [Microcystis panniformis]